MKTKEMKTKEDLLKRWNYLVDIHPGNNSWIVFRENNIRNFDNNYIISYYAENNFFSVNRMDSGIFKLCASNNNCRIVYSD